MLPRSHLTRLDFHLDVLSHSALLTSGGEAGAGGVKFHVGTDFQDRISHRGEVYARHAKPLLAGFARKLFRYVWLRLRRPM